MSQRSIKERTTLSNSDKNPEIINEIGFNENIFNKEVLNQDHIDNYSIASPDVSRRIEVDIRDLGKPLKVTENRQSLEIKDGDSKKKIEEIGMTKKKQTPEHKPKTNNEEDLNFKKIQNSKLFQKFMKEEISNEIKDPPDIQPNLYENYIKNSSKRKKSPFPNKRQISDRIDGGDQELVGYSQIFVPGAQNKMNSIYYPQQPKPQINFMDYASIPLNNINVNNENFLKKFIYQSNENVVFFPNNYYTPTKTFSNAPRNEEKNENVIALQNKLVETQKALNEEILRRTNLETTLKEQQFNQENLSKNLEDFKLKLTDQNQFYTEQRNQFEDAHSKLTHKIFHLERSEENMKLEIDEIKRKALQDSLVLTNKEEEIKDLNRKIEKLNETLRDKENLLSKKNDDLSNALKKADESRNEILNLKNYIDKLEDKISVNENTINGLSNEGDFSVKRLGELKDKIKDSFSENEKLKFQNSSANLQLNQCQMDLENYKNEMYQLKQNLLEKQQKEINLVMALEKATLQSNQLKKMLQKTEFNIEEQKNLNRNLVDKISEFATTANTSSLNNLKFMSNFYESKPERDTKVFEKSEKIDRPSKTFVQNYEQEQQPTNYRNDKGNLDQQFKVNTKKIEYKKEKPADIEYYYDSFNDRDNRFKLNDFPNDPAAGGDLNRIESGKKLFYDKYKNNNILSWDSKENERNKNYSNDNRVASEKNNKNYDNQNWNSLPAGNNLNKSTKNQISTNSLSYNNNVVDENATDEKTIEKNLLTFQLHKQEMETELRKLEDAKIRTGANIRRKNELEVILKEIDSKISHSRLKLREMNSLHR